MGPGPPVPSALSEDFPSFNFYNPETPSSADTSPLSPGGPPACPVWVSGSFPAGHASIRRAGLHEGGKELSHLLCRGQADTAPPPNPSLRAGPLVPRLLPPARPPATPGDWKLPPHSLLWTVSSSDKSRARAPTWHPPNPPGPPGALGSCPSFDSSPLCRPPRSHTASGGRVLFSEGAPGRGPHLHPPRWDSPCALCRSLRIFTPSNFCSFID